MKTRERQSDAFKEALEVCYLYGLNWKEHIMPKTFKKYNNRILYFRRNKINS